MLDISKSYELCSGRQPFEGDYEAATLYAVVHEQPEALPESVPSELQSVVFKCLEKKAGNRYESVEDLLGDLLKMKDIESRAGRSAQPSKSEAKKSIIILPFDDLSPGKDNEYFSDGLTAEIISDLSQVDSLRVISRTSAMRLRGTDKDVKAIGPNKDSPKRPQSSIQHLPLNSI